MDDVREIFLIGGRDDERATVRLDQSGSTCRLTFCYRDSSVEAEADDFFEALCRVRRRLETEGLIPFCYGASLDVYPSGMARDMGSGLSAYRLTKGEPARRDRLVGIFEAGPDVIPASVERQAGFWREWLDSLRS